MEKRGGKRYKIYQRLKGERMDFLLPPDLIKIPVDVSFFCRIQPGIFIEGGVARNEALVTVTGLEPVKVKELLPPYGLDIVTFFRQRVYVREQPFPNRRQIVGDINLERYLRRKMFTIDQPFIGRQSDSQPPILYLTGDAMTAYKQRVVNFCPEYPALLITRDGNRLLSFGAIFRYFLFEIMLRRFNFVFEPLDIEFIKDYLKRGFLSDKGSLKEKLEKYICRSKDLGLYDKYKQSLRKLGITI